jgi:CheY-like chemotaxis protein
MLADDDLDDAEMFALVLGDINPSIKVIHVKDGLSVFEVLKTSAPDLIFLDINMPQMNGWQCLSRLKSEPVSNHIPVVIYSTSSHPKDRQTALDLGAAAFLTKPSDYKILQKVLSTFALNLHLDIKTIISMLP